MEIVNKVNLILGISSNQFLEAVHGIRWLVHGQAGEVETVGWSICSAY